MENRKEKRAKWNSAEAQLMRSTDTEPPADSPLYPLWQRWKGLTKPAAKSPAAGEAVTKKKKAPAKKKKKSPPQATKAQKRKAHGSRKIAKKKKAR